MSELAGRDRSIDVTNDLRCRLWRVLCGGTGRVEYSKIDGKMNELGKK